ncbi:cytochrome-c oxidase, cbb3-type subunit III [Thermomonas flagellata]|uniref:cytochrome-c oxidase, cbb3-type subunit III n=1 Tax=Thermomonas flagellata TaxID=2888524 RepID=UPI001F042836|nr:cytochrome-c oxidase, cbb3-type subunit III [Thermomonas flagellata]
MSTGWSIYVIALVVLNIVGYVVLLWWTSHRRPGDPAPEDTSHLWDGDITEYNKPLPKWWINLFYLTILFAIGYLIWFPGLGAFAGVGHWTSAKAVKEAQARENAKLAKTFAPYANQPIDKLAQDPKALALGKSIYGNNCATCHGSTGQGALGYPNLTDDIWHWGGSPDQVLETVLHGREGVMPSMGSVLTGMGGPNAVDEVVAYVRAMGNPEALKNDYLAAQGKKLFEGVCAACHGADGQGNPAMGAPNLTDNYWLYGNSAAAIRKTIMDGRHGVMPAWEPILGDTRARLAAAYVWSLSHNKPGAAAAAAP